MTNHLGHFDTPQAAYDCYRQLFSAGGFYIAGHQSFFRNWYLVSNGGFTMLSLPKGRPAC